MTKLAIVGAETRTRENAPWNNQDYEILGISIWSHAAWMKRCDIVLEMHDLDSLVNESDKEYWPWLQKTDIPVYTTKIDKRINNNKEYPITDIQNMIKHVKSNGNASKVLNSSISQAIALGILYEYSVIDIYGVEMANSSEYHSQQPVFMFWVGFAAGRGIEINVNCTSKLFDKPIYGYEEQSNYDKIHDLINGMKQQYETVNQQKWMLDGAMQLARQLLEE